MNSFLTKQLERLETALDELHALPERPRPLTAEEQAELARQDAKIDELMQDPIALARDPVFLNFMGGAASAATLWAGEVPPSMGFDDEALRALFCTFLLYDIVKFDIIDSWDPVTQTHGPTIYRFHELAKEAEPTPFAIRDRGPLADEVPEDRGDDLWGDG